jgi:hypothetical protein
MTGRIGNGLFPPKHTTCSDRAETEFDVRKFLPLAGRVFQPEVN